MPGNPGPRSHFRRAGAWAFAPSALTLQVRQRHLKTALYLPPELHRALKEAVWQEGQSQAERIREALAAYLARRQSPTLRSLGVGEDEELSGRASEGWLERVWSER